MKAVPRAAMLAAVALACALPAWAGTAPPDEDATITAEMRAAFDAKMELIARYLQGIETGPDAETVTVANIVWLRESLYRLSIEQIHSLGTPIRYDAAADALLKKLQVKPKLGGTATELVYYPITPCRYIDTRLLGGPLVDTRTFDLAFTGGAYGGQLGCNPKAAVGGNEKHIGALAINVTIVSPTTPLGFIGVRPAQDPTTTSFVNWFQAGASVQASNAGIVSTNQQIGVPAEIEFFGSPTQFIVDVFGVFAAPTATALDCIAGPASSAVLGAATTSAYNLTPAACQAGYRPVSVNCSATGDVGGGFLRKSGAGTKYPGPASNCTGHYSGASTVTVTARATCCRMPGR